MNRLGRVYDRASRNMDRYIGKKAVFTQRTNGTVNTDTGIQSITEVSKNVVVKPYPISVRELLDFTRAGLTQIEARWTMRVHYVSAVEPGDQLEVSGFRYEVLHQPPSVLDEFGVDWVIYTRRMRGG